MHDFVKTTFAYFWEMTAPLCPPTLDLPLRPIYNIDHVMEGCVCYVERSGKEFSIYTSSRDVFLWCTPPAFAWKHTIIKDQYYRASYTY